MAAATGNIRKMPWSQRLKYWLTVLQVYRTSNLDNADSQLVFHRQLTDLLTAVFGPDLPRLRILEIGCGQRASQTILFTADGFETIGIDLEVPTFRLTPGSIIRIVRANGWERAIKSLCRHWLFDKPFFQRLAAQYGRPLPLDRVEVRVMSAAQLELPDNYFDFIFSSLVFEHIDEVPAAVREVNRVMAPRGRAWINIHLFPSLSGGHHPAWTQWRGASLPEVPPWDHLRDNDFPVDSHLNRLRLADYRRIFGECLEVLEETQVKEPAEVLTPELEEILGTLGYTREDLLTREVAFLCRKK
jgi:SAM-dependent methyltransferase